MIFYFAAAYLLGTIPFGFWTARFVKGIDIREHGSKNIGATNVFRVVGKKWGILVFILDALKGYSAVQLPEWVSGAAVPLPIKIGLAATAIIGHTFPVWLRFKGGKGVATSLGVFLAAAPVPAGITFGIWILVFIITHIISVSSLAAAALFPVVCWVTSRQVPGFGFLLAVSLLLSAFIFYTHRANIQRLRKGEEKRLF